MKIKNLVYLLALGCLSLQACSNGKRTTDYSIKNAENVNEQKEAQGKGLQCTSSNESGKGGEKEKK